MPKRYYVALTAAQRDAVLEALAFRMAGPLDGTDQRTETYDAAESAVFHAPQAEVGLLLSAAETRGLLALAHEGAAGLFHDAAAAAAYIGRGGAGAAAERAFDKLRQAGGQ